MRAEEELECSKICDRSWVWCGSAKYQWGVDVWLRCQASRGRPFPKSPTRGTELGPAARQGPRGLHAGDCGRGSDVCRAVL